MKPLFGIAAALAGLLTLAALRAPVGDGLAAGTAAPEITTGAWFNHIGRPLNLNNLRGHAVLIEFWATW